MPLCCSVIIIIRAGWTLSWLMLLTALWALLKDLPRMLCSKMGRGWGGCGREGCGKQGYDWQTNKEGLLDLGFVWGSTVAPWGPQWCDVSLAALLHSPRSLHTPRFELWVGGARAKDKPAEEPMTSGSVPRLAVTCGQPLLCQTCPWLQGRRDTWPPWLGWKLHEKGRTERILGRQLAVPPREEEVSKGNWWTLQKSHWLTSSKTMV